MMIPTEEEFISLIKNHLIKTGEKHSTFGRRVLGDSAAITRMMKGTDPRLSTVLKILRAINTPERKR